MEDCVSCPAARPRPRMFMLMENKIKLWDYIVQQFLMKSCLFYLAVAWIQAAPDLWYHAKNVLKICTCEIKSEAKQRISAGVCFYYQWVYSVTFVLTAILAVHSCIYWCCHGKKLYKIPPTGNSLGRTVIQLLGREVLKFVVPVVSTQNLYC